MGSTMPIPILIGFLVQFLFEYTPVVSEWYDKQIAKHKFFYAVIVTVVLAGAGAYLSCVVALIAGCADQGIVDYIFAIVIAVVSNQAGHKYLFKRKSI